MMTFWPSCMPQPQVYPLRELQGVSKPVHQLVARLSCSQIVDTVRQLAEGISSGAPDLKHPHPP